MPQYAFVYFEDDRDAEDSVRGRDGYSFERERLRVSAFRTCVEQTRFNSIARLRPVPQAVSVCVFGPGLFPLLPPSRFHYRVADAARVGGAGRVLERLWQGPAWRRAPPAARRRRPRPLAAA